MQICRLSGSNSWAVPSCIAAYEFVLFTNLTLENCLSCFCFTKDGSFMFLFAKVASKDIHTFKRQTKQTQHMKKKKEKNKQKHFIWVCYDYCWLLHSLFDHLFDNGFVEKLFVGRLNPIKYVQILFFLSFAFIFKEPELHSCL